jgi:hypothetical protein
MAADRDALQNLYRDVAPIVTRPRVRPDTFERWMALLAGLGILALFAVELLFGPAG